MPKIYSVENENSEIGDSKIKRIQVDLSPQLLGLIFIVLAIIFFGKQLLSIVLFLMLSFVFMCMMRPIVNWFMKKKVPKGWAIFFAYASFTLFSLILIAIIIVPLINQTESLVRTLPKWIEQVIDWLNGINIGGKVIDTAAIEETTAAWLKEFPNADNFKSVTTMLGGVFNGFATFFSAIVLSVYLVSEHESLTDILFMRIRSIGKKDRVEQLIADVEHKLGSWVLGQGTVSLLAMMFAAVALSILRVPFAIPLAVLVGILDAVPTIGASLAAIIVGIVALIAVGPVNGIILMVLMVLYQQVENNIIVPKVMGNVVGLKPLYILVGAIIMLIIAGPMGAIISVPLLVLIKIAYEFYIDLQKLEAKGIV